MRTHRRKGLGERGRQLLGGMARGKFGDRGSNERDASRRNAKLVVVGFGAGGVHPYMSWLQFHANIVRATWIRLSSVTHAFNQNQRMNNLTIAVAGASSVLVNAPASANLAPPGHYMLFLIDANGVPSVARIIRIF